MKLKKISRQRKILSFRREIRFIRLCQTLSAKKWFFRMISKKITSLSKNASEKKSRMKFLLFQKIILIHKFLKYRRNSARIYVI